MLSLVALRKALSKSEVVLQGSCLLSSSIDRCPCISESHYSTRNGTGTVSKSGLYNDATATSVTAVARPPLSPEPWNEPNSLGRHAKAEDAAMSAHARALEQARKLVAGEDDDEEEEEETQGKSYFITCL